MAANIKMSTDATQKRYAAAGGSGHDPLPFGLGNGDQQAVHRPGDLERYGLVAERLHVCLPWVVHNAANNTWRQL